MSEVIFANNKKSSMSFLTRLKLLVCVYNLAGDMPFITNSDVADSTGLPATKMITSFLIELAIEAEVQVKHQYDGKYFFFTQDSLKPIIDEVRQELSIIDTLT